MKPRKTTKMTIFELHGGEVVAKLSGMPTNWIILLFLFVTAEKKIKLASKLSFFCYLNVEIERKKVEKFDSLLT